MNNIASRDKKKSFLNRPLKNSQYPDRNKIHKYVCVMKKNRWASFEMKKKAIVNPSGRII
jgi:hypothetical protein